MATAKPNNSYVPEIAEIIDSYPLTEKEQFLRLKFRDGRSLGHVPGQFVEVSIPGIGEAPISVCSSPTEKNTFDLGVRNVGNVSAAIHRLKAGDLVGIRGPMGKGFPTETFQQKDLILIGGGIGIVPLRSLINYIAANRSLFKNVYVLYGAKDPSQCIFGVEFGKLKDLNIQYECTVDKGNEAWTGRTGVITTLIPILKTDFKSAYAAVVGPPIMYKFVITELSSYGMPDDHIYVSLERRMKCGLGKCGHCQIHDKYCCQDGPVFNFKDIKSIKGAL
jgi:sulfite reductase subunit B